MFKVITLIAIIAGSAFASDESDRAPALHGFMYAPDTMGMMTSRPEVQIKPVIINPEAAEVAREAMLGLKIIEAKKPEGCLCEGLISGLALGADE